MPAPANTSTLLDGTTPFQLTMSDDALVTFGLPQGSGVSFHDVGFMPVNLATIGGAPLDVPPGQSGLFVEYTANGVQNFNMYGAPTTASYTDLHYELVAYNGTEKFGRDLSGAPTVNPGHHQTVIAQGDLLQGQGLLNFTVDPKTGAITGITGDVKTTYVVNNQIVGNLDISVQHSGADIGKTAAGGLTLDHGTLHATYTPQSHIG